MIRLAPRTFAPVVFAAVAFAYGIAGIPARALADPVSYDDLGMHFDAPADFAKIDLPPSDPRGSEDSDDLAPVALFVFHKGKADQRIISIAVKRFDGGVDDFDSSHVSDQRKAGDIFVAKNVKIALTNGMPAYFVRFTSGATAGQYVQRFEYLVCDGTRSIDVDYSGAEGTFDEATAKAALATLYVVKYPTRRS